jgi:hypothetical protein
MLQNYQMWPVFSLAGTTTEAAELWEAGVGYTQFTEYWTPSDGGIGSLYNLTEVMGVPSVVHTPIIHARAPNTKILDAVAGYLIGAYGALFWIRTQHSRVLLDRTPAGIDASMRAIQ